MTKLQKNWMSSSYILFMKTSDFHFINQELLSNFGNQLFWKVFWVVWNLITTSSVESLLDLQLNNLRTYYFKILLRQDQVLL